MENDKKFDWVEQMDRELLDAFVDNPYECPIVIDRNGVIRFMSRYNKGLYGVAPEEAVGKYITEVNKNSKMQETLINGMPSIGETHLVGNRYQILARIPIRDEKGNIIGVLGKRIFHRTDKVKELYRKLELLEKQLKYYRDEVHTLKSGGYNIAKIVGNSAAIRGLVKLSLQASGSDAPVLITGESGTGKDACAFFIHEHSKRSSGPFIRVNCGAIPRELIESELFGYEGGAFTGAKKQGKMGKFELAQAGTIFLDEIGEMPLDMQVKLLRVLQEYEIDRVGGTKPIKVDFRLITATNKDLTDEVEKGAFRMDLFYRINIFHIQTPSLRNISEDIPAIAEFVILQLRDRITQGPSRISSEAMALMKAYRWPGNVRELRNVIERAMFTAESNEIRVEDLPSRIRDLRGAREEITEGAVHLRNALQEAEKKIIKDALRQTSGNKVKAADLLGIHRTVLYYKIKQLNIVE
ncbi:MAG: modulated sigma54 specific transcriptional regulator, Fis family [Deltaproteobacteria bacterium]|nr:modulated sigma54 specific transcriptional regulator, Fis family [Deltaproteobacteria bacterium]